jgi:guanylate kinase
MKLFLSPMTPSPGFTAKGPAIIIVFAGPTGTGKNEFEIRIDGKNGFRKCVSATTRPPRKDEVHGRNYLFMPSREEFRKLDLIESNEFNGHLYGMPRASIGSIVAEGGRGVCHMDVHGVNALMGDSLIAQSLMTVFIDAPNDVIVARARRRGGLSEEQIEKRVEEAERERRWIGMFQYRLVNDKEGLHHVDRMVQGLLLQAERRLVEICSCR